MERVFVLFALCLVVSAEKLLGRAEPIPSDKCGANVITLEDNRLVVFSLSEDSVVWYKHESIDGGWSKWKPLSDRKKMSSGPKAIRYANGTVQVFARGADRQYYMSTRISEEEWTDWTTPFSEKTFLTPPSAVVTASGSALVFGVASDTHTVWYSESTPITASTFTWSEWANLGGDSTSPVAILVDAEALVHVFIRGVNRALWHISEVYNHPSGKKWSEWECLGGVLASAPRVPVTLNGVNLVEVYARAADKALWHRGQISELEKEVEWNHWTSLGGVLASGPAVALNDDGMGDIFARATDKSIYFKSQIQNENGDVGFTQWHTLGGMFSSSPSVIVRADGFIDVFARGVDKAIWHSHQVERNGTRAFSSWHSLGGHTRKFTC